MSADRLALCEHSGSEIVLVLLRHSQCYGTKRCVATKRCEGQDPELSRARHSDREAVHQRATRGHASKWPFLTRVARASRLSTTSSPTAYYFVRCYRMSTAEDDDLKLQRASASLLSDFEKLLPRLLRKRRNESTSGQVRQQVREVDLYKAFTLVGHSYRLVM